MVTDAAKWEADTERDASEFDARYYDGPQEKSPLTCKREPMARFWLESSGARPTEFEEILYRYFALRPKG